MDRREPMQMRFFHPAILVAALICLFMVSCEENSEDGNDPGSNSYYSGGGGSGREGSNQAAGIDKLKIILQADAESSLKLLNEVNFTECNMNQSGEPHFGICPQPIHAQAFVENLYLTSTAFNEDVSCGPARLMTLNFQGDTGMPEPSGKLIDLFDPETIGGASALTDECYQGKEFQGITMTSKFFDFTFLLEATYWTVRFIFSSNPITNEPVANNSQCSLSDEYIAASSYDDSIDAHRGDIMLCKRTSLEETCGNSDFQWLDTASDTFVDERPTSPLQMPYMRKLKESDDGDYENADIWCRTDCERNEPYCGLSIPDYGFDFFSSDEDTFELHAIYVHDNDERHPSYEEILEGAPNEDPAHYYTYTKNGKSTEGVDLTFEISLDLSSIVAFDIDDYENVLSMSDAEILKKIHITDMFAKESPTNYGFNGSLEAQFSFSFEDD